MQKDIRKLGPDDDIHIRGMQTNVADDYIPEAFQHLVAPPNVLYGLFVDGELASIAGYTTFSGELAMLGRLRSDIRFHGHGFATEIMAYIREEAFKNPDICWVGANTQAENKPTHRVLEKIGLSHHMTAYGATAREVGTLETGGHLWKEIDCLKQKRDWLEKIYLAKQSYFPYGCYYLLPAMPSLFTADNLKAWTFYENESQTRVIIMKQDEKKHTYVHVNYPWDDLTKQQGLWETITNAQQKLAAQCGSDVYIWMDLSARAVSKLPADHPFELPSPWTLYGTYRGNTV